jgi:hypothetical protein
MNDEEQRRLESEFKRIRHLRTNNPFCRICGKSMIWARYERHHPDLRANSPDQIFICEDCHRELHAMLNDFPRIPSNVPKSRHRLILSQKKWAEIEEWLLNVVDLPDEPNAANDNGEDDEVDEAFQRPDVIADLEAWLDRQDGGSSK